MKTYKVFQHPDGRIEAVKQGWSWPAFFFGIIWAIVKKLWGLTGILFAIAVVLTIVSIAVDPVSINGGYYTQSQMQTSAFINLFFNLITLVISIVLGKMGNQIRENNLTKRGYQLLNTIEAENPDQAIANVKTSSNNDISINI